MSQHQFVHDGAEFEWQRGSQGPPARKRMLCFTLRRLMRLRLEPSFRSIEEANIVFLAQWSNLRKRGQLDFTSGLKAAEAAKEKQLQTIRKVHFKRQLRLDLQSVADAFARWKESAVLMQRV